MFGFPSWILWLVLFAAGAASGTYVTYEVYSGKIAKIELSYASAREKQNAEAAKMLIDSKNQRIAIEAEYAAFKDKVEGNYNEQTNRINGLRIANGRLVDAAGGLFDRNGRCREPSGGHGLSDPTGSTAGAAPAPSGCQLSGSSVADLLDLARDADAAAVYAQTGHSYAVGLKALAKPGSIPSR